ncbi:hypothetical protein ACH4T9_12705 [Micromonospora sp. NPDC020750]|uniref:hypothetical protein n=1 Tax=unclassified Micromonospora TaxID=2617518 RepID=UPI0037A731A1
MTVNQPPWQWVICRTGPRDVVVDAGVQHTRLYAAADEIAVERLTVHVYNLMLSGQPFNPDMLVCRVRRAGTESWAGVATGDHLPLPATAGTSVRRRA